MASVFKIAGREAWQIAFFDGSGRRRLRSSGTADRKAAEAIAARLEHAATMEREGLVDPREENLKRGARTPLRDLVEEFIQHLEHKGSGEKHLDDRRSQLHRLVEAMMLERAPLITVARAQAALAKLRHQRGLALRTLDRHVRAIKSFTGHLCREGLLPHDPLLSLRGFDAATDRRRVRRALSADEISRLIAAAESGPTARGLTGEDRAALYRIAYGSGLRASEIASLTVRSFQLDADPPTIRVRAGYVKNRKDVEQPIRRDLAEALRPWLAKKPIGTMPVFNVRNLKLKTAPMMRFDLEAAGIQYIDEDGRHADFHCLRHSFVTALVRSGASVKQAQVLARHSTPVLTLAVYSHVEVHELTRALEKLPAIEVDAARRGMGNAESSVG